MNPKYLYLTIDLLSISVPLLASFYPRAPFYKKWKYLLPAIAIPGIFFILWDELFTRLGVWGFNPKYLSGVFIGSLPIEEILFFICIPYSCVFTYHALNHLIEKDIVRPYHEMITSILIITSFVIGIFNIEKAYTGSTFIFLGIFLSYELLKTKARYLSRFYFAFVVILIPFFIVNGILTGSFIEDEVVWYNDNQNMGIRLGTIPVEDVFYGMLLLAMNVSLFEWFQNRSPHPSKNKKVAAV